MRRLVLQQSFGGFGKNLKLIWKDFVLLTQLDQRRTLYNTTWSKTCLTPSTGQMLI